MSDNVVNEVTVGGKGKKKTIVRRASTRVAKVAVKTNDILNKTPIVGTIKQKITLGIAFIGKKVDKVPVVGTVKKTVTKTVDRITNKTPVVKDVKKGIKEVTNKPKSKKATKSTKTTKTSKSTRA